MLECSGVQVGTGARQRVDVAVPGALVTTLAVDDHRRRQHQPVHPRGEHLGQKHRGAVVVVAAVRRGVGRIDARTDHGGLVAHHSDASPEASLTSTSSTPSGGVAVAPCAAVSIASMATTSWPASVNAPQTLDPMNPAAPVTRTLTAARTAA
jgi:hypothetical protein